MIFEANTCNLRGGAVAAAGASPLIKNSQFIGNTGEGALFLDDSQAEIINSTFVANTGSAHDYTITIWGGSPTLRNLTLHKNGLSGSGDDMGDISCADGSPLIENTIIANGARGWGFTKSWLGSACTPTIRYTNIFGHPAGNFGAGSESAEGTNGNLSVDPLLSPDLTLQDGSPCLDAGNPDSPLDPDGTPADIGAILPERM